MQVTNKKNLCNSVETTEDNLVNVTVKEERRPLIKYLLKQTVNTLPYLLRQL